MKRGEQPVKKEMRPQFLRWGLGRRCIPAESLPHRENGSFGSLMVALRSRYAGYPLLAHLVSRVPHRSRRPRHGVDGPLALEIRARSLTCSYPAPGRFGLSLRRRAAVRDLSFVVAPGEVVALAGKNGSGKSTTLRLLAGLLTPDAGEGLLGGVPAARNTARRRLGFVAEEDEFPRGLRVREILRYAAILAGYRGARARKEACLAAEAVGLEEWLQAPGAHCSRGVRRRVSLAQALVGEPRALVLDEPFTGLDPEARLQSMGAIRLAAQRGAAVILSLHEAPAIEALADRLLVLADGAVAASGTPADFIAKGGDLIGASGGGGDWLSAAVRGETAALP